MNEEESDEMKRVREELEQQGLDPDEYMGIVHAMDMMMAITPQIMRGLFSTYSSAMEAGFDEGQAFALTMQRASIWFGVGGSDDE